MQEQKDINERVTCHDDCHLYSLGDVTGGYPPEQIQFMRKNEDGTTVHGTTNEDVLAVLIHRIGELNKKFPCRENALAITKLEETLMWLNKRTQDRKSRGVEGTLQA